MATNRNSRGSTPRREKAWANLSSLESGLALTNNVTEVALDLLAPYQADVGVSRLQGITAMRIVGTLEIGNTFSTSVTDSVALAWGIAWVRGQVAAAGAGDAQIPDPNEQGERETLWLQRGILRGETTPAASAPFSSKSQLNALVQLDIKQQRKQPTPSHELVLITGNAVPANAQLTLFYNLQTMIALA